MQEIQKSSKTFFTKNLMLWFSQNHRAMPWKGEKNPYLVWLSEIILQQTRVEQGLPYFEKFKKKYPLIENLAEAPEDEVMKLWEGLGYYSRARNLHFTAKKITADFNSVFPSDYESILELKGVGTYTAAAIASFAFGLPHAVVDGNVYRVLSRFFGIETPIDSTLGKKLFASLATDLLDATQPGNYNQAIMDFGATHCLPAQPKCQSCLLKNKCVALKENRINILPVKSKRIKKRTRFFNYIILNIGEDTFIEKRTKKDIWQNLYQFPLLESTQLIENKERFIKDDLLKDLVGEKTFQLIKVSKPFKQTLTHLYIIGRFWEIDLEQIPKERLNDFIQVKRKNLSKFAFPKIIDWYLKDKSITLELL